MIQINTGNNFSQVLLHLVFIGTFAFFYVLAIIVLKPFRLHQKRKISTLLLKLSYLVYLFIFLAYIYLFLFYQEPPVDDMSPASVPVKGVFRYEYLLLLLTFLIPNFGMILRRKVHGWRTQYNIFITIANLLALSYLVLLIMITDWIF